MRLIFQLSALVLIGFNGHYTRLTDKRGGGTALAHAHKAVPPRGPLASVQQSEQRFQAIRAGFTEAGVWLRTEVTTGGVSSQQRRSQRASPRNSYGPSRQSFAAYYTRSSLPVTAPRAKRAEVMTAVEAVSLGVTLIINKIKFWTAERRGAAGGSGKGAWRTPRSLTPPNISRPGDPPTLGDRPAEDAVRRLGLTSFAEPEDGARQAAGEGASNPFSALLPWLTSISASTDKKDSSVTKATRYLVAKRLPTLTMRVVERIWSLQFVEMEDLLPAPRSLRLAEQGASPKSLQDSLVGALSHFQALQQHKAQRRVTDITTWVKCFSLYMAVLAKKEPTMVPSMVAHLHTVLRLHQRALQHFLARVRRPVPYGVGGLRKQGLEGRGPMAVRGMPPWPAADRRPIRHPGSGSAHLEGKREEAHGT